jgi:hypothetical protein
VTEEKVIETEIVVKNDIATLKIHPLRPIIEAPIEKAVVEITPLPPVAEEEEEDILQVERNKKSLHGWIGRPRELAVIEAPQTGRVVGGILVRGIGSLGMIVEEGGRIGLMDREGEGDLVGGMEIGIEKGVLLLKDFVDRPRI